MNTLQLTPSERLRVERIDELVASGGVEELIASLGDASWTVRRAAIAGLAALADDAVVPLCDWIRYRRSTENAIAAAVDALVASRGQTVTEHVTALLHDRRPDVVADAAQILGRRRTTSAIVDLRRAVANPNDNVAVAAIEALGRIGGAGGIDTLIAATRSGNFFRVFAAMQVLATLNDPRTIEPLAALLDDPGYRTAAAAALGRTGSPQAIGPLVALLDADPVLVGSALGELIAHADWNGSAKHVVTMLRTMLGDAIGRFSALLPVAPVEDGAKILIVIGRLGGPSELPVLAGLVDTPLRDRALAAMLEIGKRDDTAIAALLATAEGPVRCAILPIVTAIQWAPAIRPLLDDEDPEIRALACQALARIGDTAAVPRLFAALEDPHPRVSLAATSAIHSLHTSDTEQQTLHVLRHGSPAARRHALRIVSYLGFTNAHREVSELIAQPDPRVRELAIATRGTLASPDVDDELARLVAPAQPPATRAAAMRAIALRGGTQALATLERALDDENPWVRYYACQGLGRASHAAAIPALVARLQDSSTQVRLGAIEALSSIDAPEAWNAVLAAAASSDPDQHRAALLGIGLVAREAAVPALLAAANSPDTATRIIALSGLARHSDPRVLAALVRAARDDAEIRDAAVSLVAERTDLEAAHALIDIAVAVDDVEHPIHAALAQRSPARIAALRERSASGDERTAIVTTAALGRMDDAAATAALFELIDSPNPIVRRVAATVLMAIGASGAPAIVARMSREDPDLAVRRACAAASESV